MSNSEQFSPDVSNVKRGTEATFSDGRFYIDGQQCFELPPGSHRPEQMLTSNLLEYVMPVCRVQSATVDGGASRFFSVFQDVTDSRMLSRPLSFVQAEYVALREIFLCKDRSFSSKPGHHYPLRKPGVQGHNMDWVTDPDDQGRVRATHYDFEDAYDFLKNLGDIWGNGLTPEKQQIFRELLFKRFDDYVSEFGNAQFVQHLLGQLDSMIAKFSLPFISSSIEKVVALQERPDPALLHASLQNKLAFYKQQVSAYLALLSD